MTNAANLSKTGSLVNSSGQISLTTGVTGILPVANGGTGSSTGVSPGGSTTQIQYNNAGAFAGASNITYNGTALTITGSNAFALSGATPALAMTDTTWAVATYFQPGVNSGGTGTGDYFMTNVPTGKGFTWAINNSSKMLMDSSGNLQLSAAGTSILNSSGRKILNQTGGILQTVQATLTGSGSGPITSTTSTSWVSTGLTASITPSSTSSKILVMYNLGNIYNPSNGLEGFTTLYRNGSNISPVGTGTTSGFTASFGNGAGVQAPHSVVYLDSPASASSVTYTVYWAVNTGTGYLGRNAPVCTITLLEIAQ